MMRVLLPTGKLHKIECAKPVCESVVKMNGEYKFLFEIAKNLEVEPTGIALKISNDRKSTFVSTLEQVYIGNLTTEKVGSILSELMEKGYYDFTKIQFQHKNYMAELAFDKGESLPFSSDITVSFGMPDFFYGYDGNHIVSAYGEARKEDEEE